MTLSPCPCASLLLSETVGTVPSVLWWRSTLGRRCASKCSSRSESVGNVDHPVIEVASPVKSLLNRLLRIGICGDDAQCEVLFDFPIGVGIELERDIG